MRGDFREQLRPYIQVLRRWRAERPTAKELAFGRLSFSQFGEEQFLRRHFGDRTTGFYVDVGAHHPFQWSNTYGLHSNGWRGINIEPDPDGFALFQRHRPEDINLQLAVAATPGEARFARTGAFAGIETSGYLWGHMSGERITVKTLPLAQILAEQLPAGQAIDLLDVDCEGLDLEILASNDWQRFRPELVLAEAHDDEQARQIDDFMHSVAYEPLTRLDLTRVYSSR